MRLGAVTFILAAALSGLPAAAQPAAGTQSLRVDLDRDGRAELVTVDTVDSEVTLVISPPGRAAVRVAQFAWSLEPPSLDVAPNGSLRLVTSHLSIGRNPHEQTLTIAWRAGAYRVVGLNYGTWDRVDTSWGGTCDINLLTGRGTVQTSGRTIRQVRVRAGAPTVQQWNLRRDLPAPCRF
jgi:hypothetical protein